MHLIQVSVVVHMLEPIFLHLLQNCLYFLHNSNLCVKSLTHSSHFKRGNNKKLQGDLSGYRLTRIQYFAGSNILRQERKSEDAGYHSVAQPDRRMRICPVAK
ncbi:hypothetical protein AVEN_53157-1 [Araneus ventricosus]|uniref:Uncharacterized protein n=1 Tax=Araneus ventricosus TaxID=182803 RepID=A0A4Y2AAU1_ARAVE|nr:hypothetical protein AVEN_53157-1 [Araneus ventricosus]